MNTPDPAEVIAQSLRVDLEGGDSFPDGMALGVIDKLWDAGWTLTRSEDLPPEESRRSPGTADGGTKGSTGGLADAPPGAGTTEDAYRSWLTAALRSDGALEALRPVLDPEEALGAVFALVEWLGGDTLHPVPSADVSKAMVEAAARALFDYEEAHDNSAMAPARRWDELPDGCPVHVDARERARAALQAALTAQDAE